jgi:hypothetical protein
MEEKKTGRPGTKTGATAILEKNEIKRGKEHGTTLMYYRDMSEQVRTAYALLAKKGYTHGNDRQDWFEAEKIIYDNKK